MLLYWWFCGEKKNIYSAETIGKGQVETVGNWRDNCPALVHSVASRLSSSNSLLIITPRERKLYLVDYYISWRDTKQRAQKKRTDHGHVWENKWKLMIWRNRTMLVGSEKMLFSDEPTGRISDLGCTRWVLQFVPPWQVCLLSLISIELVYVSVLSGVARGLKGKWACCWPVTCESNLPYFGKTTLGRSGEFLEKDDLSTVKTCQIYYLNYPGCSSDGKETWVLELHILNGSCSLIVVVYILPLST